MEQVRTESKMLRNPIRGNIDIRNVTFQYENRDEKVLDNFSLSIKQGEKVGFMGPSGCGKSTVLQLLQRFYEPETGEIIIDGVDIRNYDIHHLRASLGMVSQEPVLFNDSIANNIQYNKEGVSLESIVRAANQANFNPDKETEGEANSSGFDKNVGPRGSHISGGQKQRVAIARTILR
jgi:ATP-binding cassette, subfamily B (MDR/TAP), member 1